MSYEFIKTDQTDRVAIITLNRPEVLNALNLGLSRELDQAITSMEEDEDVGAIIITGAGERAFSAGADIHENRERTAEEREEAQKERSEYTWHLTTSVKPIIGAVNGLCYGGGTVMATAMDFLVGCEKTSFRFLAVNYGQMNATWSLPRLVGINRAKELLVQRPGGLRRRSLPHRPDQPPGAQRAAPGQDRRGCRRHCQEPGRRRREHQADAPGAQRPAPGGPVLGRDQRPGRPLQGFVRGGGVPRFPRPQGPQAPRLLAARVQAGTTRCPRQALPGA